MKSKKVTMLAAALVVAVVALAGVGYATQYTAKTTSTDDVAQSAYIKVSQSETGAYDGDWLTMVYFDTTNTTDANTFAWTLKKDTAVSGTTIIPGSDMALISGALKLTVVGVNSEDDSLKLTVTTTTAFTKNANLTYRLYLVSTYTAATESTDAVISGIIGYGDYANGAWEIDGITANDGNVAFYALMFIIPTSDNFSTDPGAHVGFADSASFEFLVEADA